LDVPYNITTPHSTAAGLGCRFLQLRGPP
jgi:hypothetical protein